MSNIILYVITIVTLIASLINDKQKTKKALKKSWKAFENILPQFFTIIVVVAITISYLNQEQISKIIGEGSGILGIIGSAIVGSITLIPGFVAFPAAAELLENGAGVAAIAGFVSSLMMVGIITMPLEISFFGKKATILRNVLAFIFSIGVAFFVSWVVAL